MVQGIMKEVDSRVREQLQIDFRRGRCRWSGEVTKDKE